MTNTCLTRIDIEHQSNEPLIVLIESRTDPTNVAIEFQLTIPGVDNDSNPANWVAGAWTSDPWNSTNGRAAALTPNVGSGAALATSPDTSHLLWVRHSSTVIEKAAIIRTT